jgi:hypothetical protein
MRWSVVLGVAAIVSVLAASGVALAMTIDCTVNVACNGTPYAPT